MNGKLTEVWVVSVFDQDNGGWRPVHVFSDEGRAERDAQALLGRYRNTRVDTAGYEPSGAAS